MFVRDWWRCERRGVGRTQPQESNLVIEDTTLMIRRVTGTNIEKSEKLVKIGIKYNTAGIG